MGYARSDNNPLSGLRRLPGGCPITWALIAGNVVTFLTIFIGAGALWRGLIFHAAAFPAEPWTMVTYPLVSDGNFLSLLLGGYVLWLFGGSLERGWGGRSYSLFLALASAATAVPLWLGSLLTGRGVSLAGLWLPLAAVVVAWAMINPYERLLVYFVVPVQARWLGLITVGLVFFSLPFPFGLFALGGCGFAWWYARIGRYGIRIGARGERRADRPRPPRRLVLNPIELFRRWRRKRQFMRLVNRTGLRDLDSGKRETGGEDVK